MIGIALALAALAALCNATGDLLQRASARPESGAPGNAAALVRHLLAQWRWYAGISASLAGLSLHIGALSIGDLAAVQPVLVAELPLAVLGAAYFFRRRPTRRDWFAVAALAIGLALFVYSLAPSSGDRLGVDGATWTVGIAVVVAVVATLIGFGVRAAKDLRGGLFGAAAGVGYGLTGVLFAVAGRTVTDDGVGAALATWQTWAAVAAGLSSFVVLQSALAAGKLVAVEPGLTLANPLIAVTWGLLVFGETARGGTALLGTVAGAALLVTGVVLLARSPLLENHTPSTATEELTHDRS